MKYSTKILIVRTDRIGDVILSLPLSKIIKTNLPQTKVYFLLREYTKDLVFNHPYVDEILVLNEKKGKIRFFENLKILKEYSFDSCLVVYPTFKIALLLFLSGIKNRIGSGYRWYSLLFNKRIYEHRKYGTKHELEFNLNMLEILGIQKVDPQDVKFDIQIEEQSTQSIRRLLMDKGLSLERPITIMHPGSGGSAVDLPLNKFKELTKINTDKRIAFFIWNLLWKWMPHPTRPSPFVLSRSVLWVFRHGRSRSRMQIGCRRWTRSSSFFCRRRS